MSTTMIAETEPLEKRVAETRAEVERERTTLAEWEAKRSAAEAEMEAMQGRAGAELLDDPGAEGDIAAAIAQLQTRVHLAEKAIAAQRPRVTGAEARYLTAEADALEPAVMAAQEALAAHEAKTEKLLKQLAAHEGEFVTRYEYQRQMRSIPGVLTEAREPVVLPKSLVLRQDLIRRQRQLAVARELAAGRDPEPLVRSFQGGPELYPAYATGPEALVKTPQFLRSVERAHNEVEDLLQTQANFEAEIEEWTERGRQLDEAAPYAIARRRARLEDLPGEIAEARAQLAALTGSTQG